MQNINIGIGIQEYKYGNIYSNRNIYACKWKNEIANWKVKYRKFLYIYDHV